MHTCVCFMYQVKLSESLNQHCGNTPLLTKGCLFSLNSKRLELLAEVENKK